jgi:hypothetical protein
MHIRIVDKKNHRITLWLPLFLMWPIAAMAGVLFLPLLLLAELILRACSTNIRLFPMLAGLLMILCSLPGLRVKVRSTNKKSIVDITIT